MVMMMITKKGKMVGVLTVIKGLVGQVKGLLGIFSGTLYGKNLSQRKRITFFRNAVVSTYTK